MPGYLSRKDDEFVTQCFDLRERKGVIANLETIRRWCLGLGLVVLVMLGFELLVPVIWTSAVGVGGPRSALALLLAFVVLFVQVESCTARLQLLKLADRARLADRPEASAA